MNKDKNGPVCIAPAFTDETLARYEALAGTISDPQVKDAYQTCLNCVKKWWELPESTGRKVEHFTGKAFAQALDKPVQDALLESIPWQDELQLIGQRFDSLPAGDLRNAAFHLLWYVVELNNDREPMHKVA